MALPTLRVISFSFLLVRTGGNSKPVFSMRLPELENGMSKLIMKNGRRRSSSW